MSRTTLLIVDNDGDVCDDSEYSNAWGFGPMIWQALIDRYRNAIPTIGRDELSLDNWPKLWKADENDGLPLRPWERDVLRATYDNAMIRGADLKRMAASMGMFYEAHSRHGVACSLKSIAARLRDLAEGTNTKFKAPDVCFIGTSVQEDPWIVFDGSDDDEGRPYNVKRDTKHWYVELAAPPTSGTGGTTT